MKGALSFLFVLGFLSSTGPAFSQEITLPPEVLKRQQSVPETVLYGILLHQAAVFKDKADQLDRSGGDGSPFRRHIAEKFGLTPSQLLSLDAVALQYREESKDNEAQIADSVRRFHERNSTLAMSPGQKIPLPSEAHYLLGKRDESVKKARDNFHSLVGDAEFSRIDGLVKARIGAGIRRNDGSPQITPSENNLGGSHEN